MNLLFCSRVYVHHHSYEAPCHQSLLYASLPSNVLFGAVTLYAPWFAAAAVYRCVNSW